MRTTLAWDTSALHHFVKADRLDVLAELAEPFRNVTTQVVLRELAGYGLDGPVASADWLDVRPLDALPELVAYAAWAQRVGVFGRHNDGEATVLAWAEVRHATVVLDDRGARAEARRGGAAAHGSLWVLAEAITHGRLTEASAAGLVRAVC